MIAGLDSSFATPSAAQVAQAKAAGVGGWSGYLATRPNVGLAHPWTQADFQTVLDGGLFSIAFCSGQDDPVACKNQAAAWGVRLCLDVEGGIRSDGPWVQGWLDASGAGLYGNIGVHSGRNAAFHILAAYPASGDPNATWYPGYPRPSGPVGWQWQGTHIEFGAAVDRGWYDDWFTQGDDMADLGAGFYQGLAVLLSGSLLQRTREGDGSPGSNTDADVAAVLASNPDDLIGQVHNVTGSQEFLNLQAMVGWLEANLTNGAGQIDPAKLAAALGTASAPAPDMSGVLSAISDVETALQALTAAVQAVK